MANDQKQYQDRIDRLYEKLREEARQGGYHLNPDIEFTKDLVEGLLINEERYGYQSCPCRLSSGTKQGDIDIICPCDYRDADVVEYDACYCGLYVSRSIVDGKKKLTKVPERRPPIETRAKHQPSGSASALRLSLPIWRCRVCGYLCARDNPPEVCPICRAKSDRFEKFLDKT
ncbi:MAG: ferredoxin:glutaredoxin reductase [candidate division WOR-3 bacterium]|nr:MAG: ferredoxin:glutaredoxin reductase [candidate division WOR-3 bacterium]